MCAVHIIFQIYCPYPRRHASLLRGFVTCQALIRFFVLHRIKAHVPLLVWPPDSFEFHSCKRTPQGRILNVLAITLHGSIYAQRLLHQKFPLPLLYSILVVSTACLGLK
ncbi:hypothetical protein RJT34_11715 [Clitoria ternatea]|uniref:Uncharacterized protein n=1 Tax=Clitoria ternatea TaxID=43366 RepID=A0AAN9JP37_CLITE